MSGYDKKDAARDTKVTPREAARTWHAARDDAGVRQGGTGDRPTAQNRVDGEAKTRAVIERAREHERERDRERSRDRGGR